MKRTEYIILAGVALSLAACSAADEPFQTFDAPVAAIVAGGIDDVRSRAYDDQWEPGDQIGISATGSGKTSYDNMRYQTGSGDGNFEHVGGLETGIFFQDTEELSFSAYYPYTSSERISNGTITGVSTADQTEQKQFDYLFARSDAASYAKPAVNLRFSHMMTSMVLNISADSSTGLTADDVRQGSYYLSGIRLDGDFDTKTGRAAANEEATAADDWLVNASLTDNGGKSSYSLIVFPQTILKLTFKAIIKGETYSGVFKDLSLSAGTTCVFDITVKTTKLLIYNSNGEPNIIDMNNEGDKGSGTATVEDPFNGHEAVLMREATADQPALYVATCNIGADSPEDAGLYFWWGDIVGYTVDENGKTNFDFSEGNPAIVTHNKTLEELRSAGYIDDNDNLVPEMDAARHHWGGSWRMPTKEDMEWLLNTENCTCTYPGGVDIQSKSTGNKIFLPAAGNCVGNVLYNPEMCSYWLSKAAPTVIVSDNHAGGYSYSSAFNIIGFETYGGMLVRPVLQLPVR